MMSRSVAPVMLAALLFLATAASAQAPPDTLRLSVDEAVAHALRDGVEAAIARQNVAAAEAQIGVARSYALPEVGLSGTYTRNLRKPVIFFEIEPGETQSFEIGQDNAWFGTLALRQTVWASGRVRSGYSMAKERAAGAALAGDDAAAVIARDAKSAYFQALLAGEQTEIARRSLEQAERNVAQISARVARGITPEFEKLRAQVTVANRNALLTRARNYEAIALETLKRLIGIPLDRPLSLSERLEYTPYGTDRDEVVARALEGRRDLAALRKEALAADYQYRAQKANSRPLVYLDGNLSWQGETSAGLWPDEHESAESAAIGLSFSWPFMDGFRTKYQARAAQALAERARARARQLEDVVRLQVRSSWGDVKSIAEEIVGAEQAVQVAGRAYDIAQIRYEKGLSTLVEMLDAELALIESALNRSDTLYRYNVALAVLEYNIGGGPKLAREGGD